MNADVLMLSYLLLLSVTRPCIRRILLPTSATDIYYSMNPPICQDSYGNFQPLSNNFLSIFVLNICIIRLFNPDLQPDQSKKAAYPVLQEEYNVACYCPAHGVCTHPTASRSPRILLKPAVSSLPAPHLSICKILCSPDHP